jgi:hypothetical protein
MACPLQNFAASMPEMIAAATAYSGLCRCCHQRRNGFRACIGARGQQVCGLVFAAKRWIGVHRILQDMKKPPKITLGGLFFRVLTANQP